MLPNRTDADFLSRKRTYIASSFPGLVLGVYREIDDDIMIDLHNKFEGEFIYDLEQ